ncbi:hypothetical protein J6590_042947 [Homalodisca vitripennis]|nr:hypothetical protein J6590_095214 [Homalodisca vitripennis]KAG8248327.1 hypothetical protein J6590_042947 [Homalodisca vitripennis]
MRRLRRQRGRGSDWKRERLTSRRDKDRASEGRAIVAVAAFHISLLDFPAISGLFVDGTSWFIAHLVARASQSVGSDGSPPAPRSEGYIDLCEPVTIFLLACE